MGGQIEKLMGQEEGSLRDFVLECLGKRTSPEALLGELEPIFGELDMTIAVKGCLRQRVGPWRLQLSVLLHPVFNTTLLSSLLQFVACHNS